MQATLNYSTDVKCPECKGKGRIIKGDGELWVNKWFCSKCGFLTKDRNGKLVLKSISKTKGDAFN